MYRYLLLNMAAIIIAGLIVLATRLSSRQLWRPIVIVIAITIVTTAVFDNIMIMLDFFGYNPAHILGVHIIRAPIEDFAYAIVAPVLAIVLWERFNHDR